MYTVDLGYDGSTEETFNWTTTPPTQEGWYWVKSPYAGRYITEVVNQKSGWTTNGGLFARIDDELVRVERLAGYCWLGPLPVPESPNVDA